MAVTKKNWKIASFFRLKNKKAQGAALLQGLLSIGIIVSIIWWLTAGSVIGITGMFASPTFWIVVILFAIIWLSKKK